MKIIVNSTFHKNLNATFVNIKVGTNYRKLNLKFRFCLNFPDTCGCGFPISRANWELPTGYRLKEPPMEIGDPKFDDCDYGKGWIKIIVIKE